MRIGSGERWSVGWSRSGLVQEGGGTGLWHLGQILTLFPSPVSLTEATCICTSHFTGTDLNSSIGEAAPVTWGKGELILHEPESNNNWFIKNPEEMGLKWGGLRKKSISRLMEMPGLGLVHLLNSLLMI